MAAKSFKQMIKDGDLKRADAMKARLEDLHEEPGFNLRAEGEDLEQSIADLADYLHQGGIVPALEVRPREEGGMWVVDGHRRRRAYLKLDAEGRLPRDPNGEFWVPIVAFAGNDAERVLRVITSQEGRKLSPLELAHGYKRLMDCDILALLPGWERSRGANIERNLAITLGMHVVDAEALPAPDFVCKCRAIQFTCCSVPSDNDPFVCRRLADMPAYLSPEDQLANARQALEKIAALTDVSTGGIGMDVLKIAKQALSN
ncbi:DUF4406 domain-containing protein [Pseudomonas aeruginosa]|uniref:DUF4406 domain-containing protein n=1 Tax=Pseudomonas aeruginosa TaxID=287 RepID=UPI0027D36BFB|nr:DUF4406 domain-containing protein [Pseudomonas aeruginosa]MDQ4172605.1 DUF4406 domain-containing protein [Pseudomonas aeruginosa]MDQ4244562.1 DUF4406 domain-containing protein [Pseudomonas aeruginosa]